MRKFITIFLIISLLIAFGPVSALKAADNKSQKIIFSFANITQGNGHNWAASIGWLSEVLLLRAKEGQKLQNKAPNLQPRYDVKGMAGSCSGAAVTALFASLLQNKNLDLEPTNGLYTVDDLFTLGRALRLLAISTNLNESEKAPFLKPFQVPKHQGWWGGSYRQQTIIKSFARTLYLAKQITKQDLTTQLPKRVIPSDQQNQVTTITDLPYFKYGANIPLQEGSTGLYEQYDELLTEQKQIIDEIEEKHFHNNYHTAGEQALKWIKQQQLPTGFMTLTYGMLNYNQSINRQTPPSFANLRPIIFCNQQTAQLLLNSDKYQQEIRNNNYRINDFIIAVVDTLHQALKPSIYEPNAQEFLAGSAQNKFNISALYNPQQDLKLDNQFDFKLQSTDRVNLALGGGFMHFDTSAWPLTYYLLSRQNKLKADYPEAKLVGYISRFGKGGRRANFSKRVIRNYFYRRPGRVEPNDKQAAVAQYIDDFHYYNDHYENYFEPFLGQHKRYFELDWVGYNWDLVGEIPAAFQKKSEELLLKSVNHTRGKYSLHLEWQTRFLKRMLTGKRYGRQYLSSYGRKWNTLGYTFDFYNQRKYSKNNR